VADTNGDEHLYDEALCPHDADENLLLDDELREVFSGLPEGVSLTVISDSCHSGTVTRVAPRPTPDDRRRRFLNPKLLGRKELEDPFETPVKRKVKYPQSEMREILLSGCTDKEYSYDAKIDGTYHGAMSHYALQAIREADYRITYAQLRTRVNYLLDQAGYPQHPQLEGSRENKQRQIFS
ncbi:MAG: caspase family protein, partial [Rubrobacteraceae bacterium]